jgi:DNA invertase Pin-like site-specific DNA recombinase
LILIFPGKLLRLISASDTTVADAQRPIIEQIPAHGDFVTAVMVEIIVVGFQCNREQVFHAARNSLVPFWKLDRWGRSLLDLVTTLKELHAVGVNFVSLNDSLDFTTPSGQAMAGMLAVFAQYERDILRDRVKAGIAEARKNGKRHGRPATAAALADEANKLFHSGISKSQIAKRLGIGRTSVRRLTRIGSE